MSKISYRDNYRVVVDVYPPQFTREPLRRQSSMQLDAESIKTQIERHVDGVSTVGIESNLNEECSICGYRWETDESGLPLCCDAAQAEWKKEKAGVK